MNFGNNVASGFQQLSSSNRIIHHQQQQQQRRVIEDVMDDTKINNIPLNNHQFPQQLQPGVSDVQYTNFVQQQHQQPIAQVQMGHPHHSLYPVALHPLHPHPPVPQNHVIHQGAPHPAGPPRHQMFQLIPNRGMMNGVPTPQQFAIIQQQQQQQQPFNPNTVYHQDSLTSQAQMQFHIQQRLQHQQMVQLQQSQLQQAQAAQQAQQAHIQSQIPQSHQVQILRQQQSAQALPQNAFDQHIPEQLIKQKQFQNHIQQQRQRYQMQMQMQMQMQTPTERTSTSKVLNMNPNSPICGDVRNVGSAPDINKAEIVSNLGKGFDSTSKEDVSGDNESTKLKADENSVDPSSFLSQTEEDEKLNFLLSSTDNVYKDDISSFLEDSLVDFKNSSSSSPPGSFDRKSNLGSSKKKMGSSQADPQLGLLQKMAEIDDDQSSGILSDLLFQNSNFSKTNALDSPNVSTVNSTPNNHAIGNNASTPESLIIYGGNNNGNNSAESSAGRAAGPCVGQSNNNDGGDGGGASNKFSITLSDFESPLDQKFENIDPKKIKMMNRPPPIITNHTPLHEISNSPSDYFNFEKNDENKSIPSGHSTTATTSVITDLKNPKFNDLSKFKKLLPPNSPSLKNDRRGSVSSSNSNPLSPSKISKAGFSKNVIPPIKPFSDATKPRSPSSSRPKSPATKSSNSSISPNKTLRKSKSTLNTKSLNNSSVNVGKIKALDPKPKRTFSFDQCSSTLDFTKNFQQNSVSTPLGPQGGMISTFSASGGNKVYSFIMEPLGKQLERDANSGKKSKNNLNLNINTKAATTGAKNSSTISNFGTSNNKAITAENFIRVSTPSNIESNISDSISPTNLISNKSTGANSSTSQQPPNLSQSQSSSSTSHYSLTSQMRLPSHISSVQPSAPNSANSNTNAAVIGGATDLLSPTLSIQSNPLDSPIAHTPNSINFPHQGGLVNSSTHFGRTNSLVGSTGVGKFQSLGNAFAGTMFIDGLDVNMMDEMSEIHMSEDAMGMNFSGMNIILEEENNNNSTNGDSGISGNGNFVMDGGVDDEGDFKEW